MSNPPANSTNTFSCRAECQYDVDQLKLQLDAQAIANTMETKVMMQPFPDVGVELKLENSMDVVLDILRQIPDSHVMIQTLKAEPLGDNELKRNYNLS
ncbi:hypothetical protein ACKF11_13590 [Methylobacillus sp. Pita2]|uniref:hypothetical protein n=1 Tax=Methylobacillus sp. Pita2 TaxID=3383245 RepID=UPI0038B4B44F